MELHTYEWTFRVGIFGMFSTEPGDQMEEMGPDQFRYYHSDGSTSNLSFSTHAIEDFIRRDYLKLIKTEGERGERFEDVAQMVIYADRKDADGNALVSDTSVPPPTVVTEETVVKVDVPEKEVEQPEPEAVDPAVEDLLGGPESADEIFPVKKVKRNPGRPAKVKK